jgi:hypothetical protein
LTPGRLIASSFGGRQLIRRRKMEELMYDLSGILRITRRFSRPSFEYNF